jgi:hypothetical protein
LFVHFTQISPPPLRNQTQEIQLWGDHGENFDEAGAIEKSKQGFVITVFSDFTLGSFKGN